ncbi:Na+/H+ antiporter subunit D [Catalinimonas niigatensis]|uniref:Na+/H+ antiporter subunit D n=1 Tax=Catalinimonas niigatensis TaxID=1397264 RepID=UPI0026669059|nr:Na+/H+ antiporter subunit D [Catalinimonas niigatensis]WPP52157.1 Na+/H+ antiporter subunit D [Catalinimonas niigatensis]
MTNVLITIPLLIPLITALGSLFFWKRDYAQKILYLLGSSLTLAGSVCLLWITHQEGIVSMHIGNFQPPFAITLVSDLFSALMIVATAILGFLIFFYAEADRSITNNHVRYAFYPALMFMLLGIMGSFLTADIFNLYVWFEVMLVGSFALLTLGGEREQLEGSIKYVTINFIASAILLAGIGVLYGISGSTNMADLSIFFREENESPLVYIAAIFFLLSFGIKSAIFPLFFWLPATYHTPPVAVSAIIAGLLTKVGVYALIRTFTIIIPIETAFFQNLMLTIAALTMLVGVLGAVAQFDFRKLLAFHIISQIGYMVMGLAIYTPLAVAGAIFFILHNILVKTNLFFISGIVYNKEGTFSLKKLGGYYKKHPFISLLFFISAFSLAGIPPLSGFWGKYYLARAGLDAEQYIVVAVSLVTGLLTLFSMAKIWRYVFWRQKPQTDEILADAKYNEKQSITGMLFSSVALSFLVICLSLFPEPLVQLTQRAADQLFQRDAYIEAVLNINTEHEMD